MASFLAATAAAVACHSIVGIEDSPAAASAGSGGDASVDPTPDAGCKLAQPPTAPVGADSGGSIEFAVAVREVDLGDRAGASGPSWPTVGYDLDKLCTCAEETLGSCKAPNKVVCDGEQGRDNALGYFLFQVHDVFKVQDFGSDVISTGIEGGNNTILIRVRGYNGAPNDAKVEVSWFASADFDKTNSAPPKWDGSDEWAVISSSLNPAPAPDGGVTYSVDDAKYIDKSAFVTNSTLVVSLPEGTLALSSKKAITFAAAIFTAKVTQVGGAWNLDDGVLAGITKVSDVLGLLPLLDDPITNQPICTDNLAYAGAKALICDSPDMSIIGTPAKTCDYVSLGVGVRATPAKLGPASIISPPTSPCAAGKDPANDSC
jgi:hypothetical protein